MRPSGGARRAPQADEHERRPRRPRRTARASAERDGSCPATRRRAASRTAAGRAHARPRPASTERVSRRIGDQPEHKRARRKRQSAAGSEPGAEVLPRPDPAHDEEPCERDQHEQRVGRMDDDEREPGSCGRGDAPARRRPDRLEARARSPPARAAAATPWPAAPAT